MSRDAILERPLPNNLDAERAVLAAPILDNSRLVEVTQYTRPEDFFLRQHRLVYLTMVGLAAQGKPIDLVTLTEELGRRGDLEAAGGAPYLGSICDGMPRISNLKHHADIVRELARRRNLIHFCYSLQEAAFEGSESTQQILENRAASLISMMSEDGTAAMPSAWEDAVLSAMDEIVEGIRYQDKVMRLNFGITKLDEMTSGLRRQDVVLIVGITSHGKSTIAMQLAVNADDAGYRGLVFSAEMSKEALAKRELAHTANVPLFLLRRPEMIQHPDIVINKLTEAAVRERTRKLMVIDRDVRPSRVWTLSEMIHRTKGLDFVIVDYDQLVVRAGLRGKDDEFQAQARFMAQSLALAKRLNICFVLLCQPRKVDEDVARGRRPPRVEQIFGSSATANTAHHVIWIMREYFLNGLDEKYENLAKTYILKARNDRTGVVEHGFDPNRVLFIDKREPSPEPVRGNGLGEADDDRGSSASAPSRR